MPINKEFTARFFEGGRYHVFNRTNNKEKLFLDESDKQIFMGKYDRYIRPFTFTYAWTLIPNHFHLVNEVRKEDDIKRVIKAKPVTELCKAERNFLYEKGTLNELMSSCYKRFFLSYAIYFNDKYNRKGNLFNQSFRRVLLETEIDVQRAVTYVHLNAQKHKLTDDFTTWKWSSWQLLNDESDTSISRGDIFRIFESLDEMFKEHQKILSQYYLRSIEE